MSERLVPVPRRARSWQPNPALLLVSTARAFAAAHWDEVRQEALQGQAALADEVDAHDDSASMTDDALLHEALEEARPQRSFSAGGLRFARDDFQPLQIRPFNQPLSELSRQALQRFNAELAAENPVVDADSTSDALMAEANAEAVRVFHPHPLLGRAPFMPDIYEVDESPPALEDASQDSEEIDPSEVAHDTLTDEPPDAAEDATEDTAQADACDDIEATQVDADTDADAEIQTQVLADDASEAALASAAESESASETTDEALSGVSSEEPSEEPSDVPLHSELVPDTSEQMAAQGDAEPVDTPTLEADAPEADLSEAHLSEADLTQDDVIAADALVEADAEAVDAAVDAAMNAAQQAAAQAVPGVDLEEVARREAEQYQLGYTEGERMAREAMAQEIAAQRTVLEGVTQQLHALLQDPQQFFEPLKRLAVHVAEQVVLQELKTSPQVIAQLIQRCLDALDHPAQGLVVVELHPQDKARLLKTAPELIQGMRIETADDLHVGSVRLFANDAVVEDLVEHRMHTLVRGLQVKESAWQSRSALLQEPSPESQPVDPSSESDDVHP